MSSKSLVEKIQHQIGTVIDHVGVEIWKPTADTLGGLICVCVELQNAASFVFLCNGDGRVGIRSGPLKCFSEDTYIQTANEFTGEALESVEFTNSTMLITTTLHRMEIINNCDELVVVIDGKHVAISNGGEVALLDS